MLRLRGFGEGGGLSPRERRGRRTDDELDLSRAEAGVHEYAPDLALFAVARDGIQVVRPLDPYLLARRSEDALGPTGFGDRDRGEVLDEDELGAWKGGEGRSEEEGELQAAGWGEPDVRTAPAPSELRRG